MSGLSFLKTITVEAPQKPARAGGGPRKERNPELPFAIRIFKDGSIYPSKELVERFSLEYQNENAEVPGQGMDIFAGKDFPTMKNAETLIIVNITSRENSKLDAFGRVDYDENGVPKSSVLEQGSNTFGKKTLLPMLKELYNLEPDDQGLDLVLLGLDGEEALQPFKLPDGKKIAYIPKAITRGESKGEGTVSRRENPLLFVLYPKQLIPGFETHDALRKVEKVAKAPVDKKAAVADQDTKGTPVTA